MFVALREEVREHGSRGEAQEERLKSLRTMLDAREEHFRWLSEKMDRSDLDVRVKEAQVQLVELGKQGLEMQETLQLAVRRLSSQEQVHDEMSQSFRRMEH